MGDIKTTTSVNFHRGPLRGFEIAKGWEDKEINLPQRQTLKAAGYDFECSEDTVIPSYQIGIKPTLVPTGVKAFMRDTEFLALYNRSSNPLKPKLMLTNGVGVIDGDYYSNPDNDGHIMGQFINLTDEDIVVKKGDRIFQGVFQNFYIADGDSANGKRTGGFGSTEGGAK